jgi:hypothetical protein
MDSVIFLGRSQMQKSQLKPASVEQYKVKAVHPLAQMDKTTDAARRFLAFTLYILAKSENLCFTRSIKLFLLELNVLLPSSIGSQAKKAKVVPNFW